MQGTHEHRCTCASVAGNFRNFSGTVFFGSAIGQSTESPKWLAHRQMVDLCDGSSFEVAIDTAGEIPGRYLATNVRKRSSSISKAFLN